MQSKVEPQGGCVPSLELKIPPDVIWVAVAVLMWLTSRVAAGIAAGEVVRRGLALILIVIGTVLIATARNALDRAGTTWHPSEPGRTTSLVTSGVYRFSRNPTYLGMQIVLLSWAFVLASPAAALVSVIFGVYIDRFQIRPEEMTLAAALGQEYRDYVVRVRRWV
jgi:protein-S-isoprenylcysteine O-methyltransferase Ste14